MVTPVYRTSKYGLRRAPKETVRVRVGPYDVRMKGLRRPKKGQFGSTKEDTPLLINLYRWPSAERYHRLALEGQVRELENAINGFIGNVNEEGIKVIYNALLPAYRLSQVYCPKDTMDLVRSGFLEIVHRRKGKDTGVSTIEMGYGRTGMPFYAVYVHEMLQYRHVAPTRAKFLEAALKEEHTRIRDRITTGLRAITNNGTG